MPDTPLGYAFAVFSVLIIAASAYAASWPVGEFLRGGLPGPAPAASIEPPEGVKSYEVVENAEHIEGNLDYPQSPPVGGNHDPVWQNCGFYEQSIAEENAVHSMEHGAVWIAYSFDLPQEQVERLRDLAKNHSYVLVSPYPGLGLSKAPVPQLPVPEAPRLLPTAPKVPAPAPAPEAPAPVPAPAPAATEPTIVASAWGKQLNLWSAEDPDLERFIRAYSQGPQAPEQGAACTSGVGSPQ